MTAADKPAEAFQLREWERRHLDERGIKPVPFELTPEQVAAQDETAGIHAADSALPKGGEKDLPRGGEVSGSGHTGGVMCGGEQRGGA